MMSSKRQGTKVWRVHGITLELDSVGDPDSLLRATASALRVSRGAIARVELVKRSFDARRSPRFVHTVDATVAASARVRPKTQAAPAPKKRLLDLPTKVRPRQVAVVGAGPGGLFAALTLAHAGLQPVLFDRGKAVGPRGKDVGALINRARFDPESNLCFGEGGAGTWSDGKLTTRIGAPEIRHVLETLHLHGGPERILTDGKPHLGTDKLVKILRSLRGHLEREGVDVRYSARVDGLVVRDGKVVGLIVDGLKNDFDAVILATGHSARDTYRALLESGVVLEPKSFAVGFRVEHAQAQINEIQYGSYADHPGVPTADYRLAVNFKDANARGVYSFCMCPGGVIMPTATAADEVVVNGMSNASRSGRWANSALVVTVTPADFGGEGPLAGIDFQRRAETLAAQLGGGSFRAPGQSLTGLLSGRVDKELRKTTYRPGVVPSALDALYPTAITTSLKRALIEFDKRLPGYVTADAILHGVETRTSAPVRIVRGDNRQSVAVAGLYPVGEGAGYAGGIVSAAVDGVKSALALLRE